MDWEGLGQEGGLVPPPPLKCHFLQWRSLVEFQFFRFHFSLLLCYPFLFSYYCVSYIYNYTSATLSLSLSPLKPLTKCDRVIRIKSSQHLRHNLDCFVLFVLPLFSLLSLSLLLFYLHPIYHLNTLLYISLFASSFKEGRKKKCQRLKTRHY